MGLLWRIGLENRLILPISIEQKITTAGQTMQLVPDSAAIMEDVGRKRDARVHCIFCYFKPAQDIGDDIAGGLFLVHQVEARRRQRSKSAQGFNAQFRYAIGDAADFPSKNTSQRVSVAQLYFD